MFDFIISLLIFICFSIIGGLFAFKIPKINISIPEPIISIISFGVMVTSFYYNENRIIQIIISLFCGFTMCYLLNNDKK